jgi:DNA-binding transcriptional LysR family regulator
MDSPILRDELTVLAAGERLLAQLHPALRDIQAALTDVGQLRAKPAGVVRLIASPMAVAMIVNPKLPKFVRDYPDVMLDITTEGESHQDLVAQPNSLDLGRGPGLGCSHLI